MVTINHDETEKQRVEAGKAIKSLLARGYELTKSTVKAGADGMRNFAHTLSKGKDKAE